MGAMWIRVQTADKNIAVIHMTSVQYLSCVYNKQIQVIILFSSMEKLLPSESGEKYAYLQVKTVQNKYLGGFWCERTGSIIMDYRLWPETMV